MNKMDGTPAQKDHLKTTVIKVSWLSGYSVCLVNRRSVVRDRPRSHFIPTLSSYQRGKSIQKQTEGTPEQKDHLKTKKSRSCGVAVKAPV